MMNILRMMTVAFCMVSLTACGNPIDDLFKKTDALGKSLQKAKMEILSARMDDRLEEARILLTKSREEIDQFVTKEFDGDRCILRDEYCSFDNANRNNEKAAEIKEAMIAFNKWYEDEIRRQQQTESEAVHDGKLLWSPSAIARFVMGDHRNPSWQDVVMFQFFIKEFSFESDKKKFCQEAQDVMSNEFKRRDILDKWRAELLKYDPVSAGRQSLFRTHWIVTFGEYDANKMAFANQGKIWQTDPGPRFDREQSLRITVDFSGFCSFSPRHDAGRNSALVESITRQTGEEVNLPDKIVLHIDIKSGTDALFDDIPIEKDRAEALIKHYEKIPNWNRRLLRAVMDYEVEPTSLVVNEEWQRRELNISATARNITFYAFSKDVTGWGKNIHHKEVLDMPLLLSFNIE